MSSAPAVDLDEFRQVVHLLASGLTEFHRGVALGEPLTLPFPASLQRGLDRLSLACVRAGVDPPPGVPRLIEWCHRPLRSWPGASAVGDDAGGTILMDSGIPTRECAEWAITGSDVEAEIFESGLVNEVRRACSAAGRQDSYVAFRELVISQPVLTELEFQRLLLTPTFAEIAGPLKRCYPIAPVECEVDGHVACCADCQQLLVRSTDGLECINDRCSRRARPVPGRRVPVVEQVRWLAAPIRTFVASPGRAELRLRDAVTALGARVDLWPDFDAYDLLIVFPDGMRWAVDVKDWANPYLLARHVRPVPCQPWWDRSFVVPAKEAVRARPGYLQALRRHARVALAGSGTEIVSEQALLAAVGRRLPGAVDA